MIKTFMTVTEDGFLSCPTCKISLRYECQIQNGRFIVFGLNCEKCRDQYILRKEKGSPDPSQKK